MMPRFQNLLSILQHPHTAPTPVQISEAKRTRKRLLDAFSQYESAAKRILALPSPSPTHKTLQRNVYNAAAQFLHMHMLPLRTLPKVIDKKQRRAAGLIADGGSSTGVASGASSVSGGAESEQDAEEKRLKEQLMVLEEQSFLVDGMIREAKRLRRFEEVGVLERSLRELEEEIEKVRKEVERLDELVDNRQVEADISGGG